MTNGKYAMTSDQSRLRPVPHPLVATPCLAARDSRRRFTMLAIRPKQSFAQTIVNLN